MDSRLSGPRCEICRRADRLGKHVTQALVRGERSCNHSASEYPEGWMYLCGECHGSVHRYIEEDSSRPGIQIDALDLVIERLERAFLGESTGKRSVKRAAGQ